MKNMLLARFASQGWLNRYPRGWPALLFMMIVAVTVLSVAAIERADDERRQLELERNVTEIASGLQRRGAENIAILAAGAALFETREEVTYADFRDFASGLYSKDDYHGSLGMGWARVMDVMVASDFETAMRGNLDPAYMIYPRPDVARKIAIPIVYLDPMTDANRAAIGFDLYSEANRRRAMEDAIRLRQPVMSSKVHLVQDRGEGEASGFLILMPVFQHVAGTRRIKGFVYSPFRAREFLSAANELSRVQNVEVALYDSAPKPENLLAVQELAGETGMTADRDIVIGNHKWVLRVSIKNTGALSVLSSVVLVLGILMGLLVTIIARLIIRRSNEDRRTVDLMTQQAAIRNSLTRELNHRVKNTLANVLSIVALTRRGATSIDDFAESLGARIRALSATHDLLSQTDWTDAPVEEIIRSELAPYMRDGDSHVDLSGPSVSLAPKDALSLGLAVHELATNAAKYGAFSVPGGMVSVRWKLLEPELAEIEWREAGGPPVVAPAKRGFGRDLIEKIVAHELRSQVDLRFNPEGVECTLQIPVRRRGDFALRAPVPVPAPMPAPVEG